MQVDVTNFVEIYPKVVEDIKRCSFIAIDMEFTGLSLNQSYSPSLFDSLEDRYKKLRVNAQSFIPCQLGLSMFTKDDVINQYSARTYSFYCCPRFYGTQSNCCFSADSGSIEFLADNSFDFNRFAKNGIPFLNEHQEQVFRNYMKDKFTIDLPLSFLDRLNDLKCEISEWLSQMKNVKQKINCEKVISYKPFINSLVNYLIVDELRNQFKNTWIDLLDKSIVVKCVTLEERKQFEKNLPQEENEIIEYSVGLTRVVRSLIEADKPIVGNNMMIDLVMMYQHFIQPLPVKLKDFKDQILNKFKLIFDVKAIVLNLKKDFLALEDFCDTRTLDELYHKLAQPSFPRVFPNQPIITKNYDYANCNICNHPHDAGADAYATGYVFLRLCSVKATADPQNRIIGVPTWSEIFSSILPFKNRINLIRAAFHHMDLEATSQKAVRPEWLVLKCDKPQTLSVAKVHSLLSSYGTIDFRPLNSREVILAIGNFRAAREIMEKFRVGKAYKITRYNYFRHSEQGRLFLWTTILVGSGLSGYLLNKALRG